MGCAADACHVDSSGHAALGEHVGAGFDEDSLSLAEALPHAAGEVFCDECVGALEGANPSCLQIFEIKQENRDGEADCRVTCRSPEGVESVPLQLPHTVDARAKRVMEALFANPGDQRTLEKLCRELRRKQEDRSEAIPGGNENDFRQVAAAIAPPPWNAVAGFRGKSDCSSFGGWIQQHERVHSDVPQAIGDDADALFEKWNRAKSSLGKLTEAPCLSRRSGVNIQLSKPLPPRTRYSAEERFHPCTLRTHRRLCAADGFVLLALQLPEFGHCHFQLELPLGIRIIHATDDHRLP